MSFVLCNSLDGGHSVGHTQMVWAVHVKVIADVVHGESDRYPSNDNHVELVEDCRNH